MLSAEEIERFARHIVLKEIGGEGQKRLRQARVLVVGAGGLGSPLLLYLAAAGVGTLGVVDDDGVSLSNLQRQVLYGVADLKKPKVEQAAAALLRLDPALVIEPHFLRLNQQNAENLLSSYDVIADCSDNFETRFLLADAAEKGKKPLVHAAINGFAGSLTVFCPWQTAADGKLYPRYVDLYPPTSGAKALPKCSEIGVLGALAGLVGCLQAIEVIRQITPFGEALLGRLLLVDALDMRFQTIFYERESIIHENPK